MIHAGQTIENPVTGERLVFCETALQTGGAYTRFDAYISPGGHVHCRAEVRPALKIESLIETM